MLPVLIRKLRPLQGTHDCSMCRGRGGGGRTLLSHSSLRSCSKRWTDPACKKKHSHSSCLFNSVGYCCCLPSPNLTGKNPWEPIGAQQLQQGARVSDSSGNVPGLLELRYSCQCKRRVPKSHQHLINPER